MLNCSDQVVTNTTPSPGGGGSAQVTVMAYDQMGRVLQTTLPDGGAVTNLWLPTGQMLATGGARTYAVSNTYDYAGRMATMTTWTNTGSGTWLGGATTSWYYDTLRGWLTNKVYADGHGTLYSYYPNGKLYTRTWARGLTTTYTYDGRGDLALTYYSDGVTPGITNNVIDRLQRVATVYDGVASPRNISFNVLNQKTGETYSGGLLNGLEVTNAFDTLYRPSGVGAGIAGTQYNYGYDNASRLASVSDGTYSANYTYLANSPLVGQIVMSQSSATRMTVAKNYDYLNRNTSVTNTPRSGATPWTFGYVYNAANQRTQINLADGSRWNYGYDTNGQVISGYRYWSDNTVVAGEQFQYTFDTIGNRTATLSGGDQNGNNLRSASYIYNNLNEYTSRSVPGGFDVLGQANASASVSVNGAGTYRHAEFYQSPVTVTNGSGPVWQNVMVAGTAGSLAVTNTGHVLVHPTPENFSYDLDGNLLSDGCWNNTRDGENRLIAMQSVSAVPTNAWKKLNFAYDNMGRRTRKIGSIWNGSAWVGQYTNLFLYDGWNLIAELNGANNSLIRSYVWGQDLSGTMQGAGGVGGLLVIKPAGADALFVANDANGNVAGLLDATNGTVAVTYGYGPFGELIEMNSFLTSPNPFRFSTKYYDDETDLVYYGARYLATGTGRWLSRDPIKEGGGLNIYATCSNDAINQTDYLGQYEADFHFCVIYYLFRAKCFNASLAYQIAHASEDIDDNPLTNPVNLGEQEALGNQAAAALLARLHFINSTPTRATRAGDGTAVAHAFRDLAAWGTGNGSSIQTGLSLHTLADTWAHDGFTAFRNVTLNGAGNHPDLTMAPGYLRPHLFIGHSEFLSRPDYPYLRPARALQAAHAIYLMIPDMCGCANALTWGTVSADLARQFAIAGSEYDRSIAASRMIESRFNDGFDVWDFGHQYNHGFDPGH